jgi:hypothetical protein
MITQKNVSIMYLVNSISAQCGCVTFPAAQDPPESKKKKKCITHRQKKTTDHL